MWNSVYFKQQWSTSPKRSKQFSRERDKKHARYTTGEETEVSGFEGWGRWVGGYGGRGSGERGDGGEGERGRMDGGGPLTRSLRINEAW